MQSTITLHSITGFTTQRNARLVMTSVAPPSDVSELQSAAFEKSSGGYQILSGPRQWCTIEQFQVRSDEF